MEAERPGTHTIDQLVQKREYAEKKYVRVVFVGQTSNIKTLQEAVGEQNAIRRGIELLEFINEMTGFKTRKVAV